MTPAEVLRRVAAKDARYVKFRPAPAVGVIGPAEKPPACVHLGDQVPGPDRHRLNLGHVRDWKWCTHPDRPLGDAVCPCRGCGPKCRGYSDGVDPPPPPRRHVLFHVMPVAGNGVWQRAAAQLDARRGLFDGRAVVGVVTGAGLDPPDAVRRLLPWADVVAVPNDRGLREVATWAPLWDRLGPVGDADAVLYCHAKGVTRRVDPGNSCQWWASLLWSLALDHWPLVAAQLKSFPVAGPFKKVGYGFGAGHGRFHYSGTFFWVRGKGLARRLAVPPPRMWWGVEAWPGLAFDVGEAGCLFLPGKVPALDVYDPHFWRRVVLPEYREWLKANPPSWPPSTAPTR